MKFEMECPCCKRKDPIGFLGGNMSKRFFCRDCSLEFISKHQIIKFIVVDTNGVILK
jgi:transposase-like protein